MTHVHNEECEQLHEALQALQARQQPPRGAIGIVAGQVALPERVTEPEGDTPEVETEIERIRTALEALECDR
jgi:hypothetical protein